MMLSTRLRGGVFKIKLRSWQKNRLLQRFKQLLNKWQLKRGINNVKHFVGGLLGCVFRENKKTKSILFIFYFVQAMMLLPQAKPILLSKVLLL